MDHTKHTPTDETTLLSIRGVSKRFPGNEVPTVCDINLDIYAGEMFALLGPSGCGKTTLMRMISGFETPDSGSIHIGSDDITHLPPYHRPMNMMFQSYALFPHMTVEQNVAFGLRQEPLTKEEKRNRVYDALNMVKMAGFSTRKPNQLSGGQQQRVALARSIVKRPRLLLLDEPLGALDRQIREHTQLELINIQSLLGITFIIVTHDQEEAMVMADRIAVMHQGSIMQVGTPKDIYETPNSRFIAHFIGPINLFYGTVMDIHDSGYITIHSQDTLTDIAIKTTENVTKDDRVWVAVRHEEMAIHTNPANANENSVKGTIIDIAFLGNQIIYHVELLSEHIVHVSVPTSARNIDATLTVGDDAYVSWHDTDGVVLTS